MHIRGSKMKIYIGNTGTLRHHELMKINGWGNVHLANAWSYPKKNMDWILDNGAYHYWRHGLKFDDDKFLNTLEKMQLVHAPDFIVCPDIVAGGNDSLEFSLDHALKIPSGYNLYLPVQDGMDFEVVDDVCQEFDGLFVGGTLPWKMITGKQWVDIAHSNKLKCHIGKVGTFKRLLWAKYIGADSIDSSTFVQVPNGFNRLFAIEKQMIL